MLYINSIPLPLICNKSFGIYNKKITTVDINQRWLFYAWRRPTLPGPCGPSTIGAGGLNGRVRDGYVWNPSAIATKRAFVKQMLP